MKMFKKTVRVVALSLGLLLMAAMPTCGGEKTLSFTWEQEISSDFAGWQLFSSESSASYDVSNPLANVVYAGTVLSEYEKDVVFESPDGASKTYYFVIRAYDESGNYSGFSNEVTSTIDFAAPGIPAAFGVEIKPR